MNIELKVKSCSLAAEARIIRNLANSLRKRQAKILGDAQRLSYLSDPTSRDRSMELENYGASLRLQRLNITDHRRTVVRNEASATHLARAFIGGMPYKRVEAKCWTQPDWTKVLGMVKKYMVPDQDNRPIWDRIKEWREAA